MQAKHRGLQGSEADQKLSGIYALHPRAINVTPIAELIREDEEIELVDLKELVSTRLLSERIALKKRAPISRRVKRSRTYGKKHAPLAAAIRRNLALSIFSLAPMLAAGAKAGTASDSEEEIGDQMSPSAIQHRALQRINQSGGPTGRASPGSGGGRRGSEVAGQVGAGALGDTIAPND